jgi:nitroreductase
MDIVSLGNLFKSRESIRKWKDTPIPESLLAKAIEVAEWPRTAAASKLIIAM